MNIYDIVKKPLVTEKATSLQEQNIYTFEVSVRANKKLVKQAIFKLYGIMPRKVNIAYSRPKRKRNRYGFGFTTKKKKAYVYLNKKDKIELYDGV